MRWFGKYVLGCMGRLLSLFLVIPFILRLYNYLFEHSSGILTRFLVRFVQLPDVSTVWKIKLLNGKSVFTAIEQGNIKTVQFALSYKWHSPALNMTEKLLNAYYPVDVPWIDVGSNLGLRSLLSLSEHRPVFFIEPNEEVNKLNIDRCRLNNFDNYVFYPVGASDKKGSIEFTIDTSTYCSTIEEGYLTEDIVVDYTEIISIDTLDNLFADKISLYRTACIKIDVEGHELKVLAGSKNVLSAWVPTLIVEVNERDEHLAEFLDVLLVRGYQVFEIGEFSGKYFKPVVQDQFGNFEQIAFNDFLAVHDKELLVALSPYIVMSF